MYRNQTVYYLDAMGKVVVANVDSVIDINNLVAKFEYVSVTGYIENDLYYKVYFRGTALYWVYVVVNNGVVSFDVIHQQERVPRFQQLFMRVAEYMALLD